MTPATHAGLAPVRTTLANGAVLQAKRTRKTPAVTINLAVRTGSAVDPPGRPGAMFLLSRVIDRGTAARSAAAVAEDLENRGIALHVSVTRHTFTLACTCLSEDFDVVLGLLGEIAMSPSVPEDELATRKGEIITAIRQDEDNPAVRAVESVMELLYPGGHPYGRRTKGSIEIVDALTRSDLLALHASHFVPGALSAVVVGDVDESAVMEQANRIFGEWRSSPGSSPEIPPVPAARERRRLVLPMMNKAQADIAYGFTTIRRNDPSYYAGWLMNHVFGQYSLGGRLGDNIRERQGMAYYVSSSFDANVAEGPLLIRAGVSPANVDRAVASIDDEVARLGRDGVTQQELDESRQYLIGAMPRALETNAGIATFLQTAEFFALGSDHDVRLPGLLRDVTLDEVNSVAARFMDPGRATIVIAGPYAAPDTT